MLYVQGVYAALLTQHVGSLGVPASCLKTAGCRAMGVFHEDEDIYFVSSEFGYILIKGSLEAQWKMKVNFWEYAIIHAISGKDG